MPVPAPSRRDLDRLCTGLVAWLRATRPDRPEPRVDELSHASAGLSNETVIARISAGPPAARSTERLVVRLPAVVPSFPDTDLARQAMIHEVVAAGGLPTPVPVTVELDEQWLGVPFIVMPFVTGHIPGPASAFDPWVIEAPRGAQQLIQQRMIEVLASLHTMTWRGTGADGLRGADATLRDDVRWWADYLEWAADGDPPPRLAELIAWCGRTCPSPTAPPSLLWGDARLENLIFTNDTPIADDADGHDRDRDRDRDRDHQRYTVAAVLDWELASVGPGEMDLAWYLVLDQAVSELSGGQTVPGFPPDDEAVAWYEAHVGRPVEHLAWHEIFALTRSILISFRLARVAELRGIEHFMPGGDRNPLVPLADARITRFPHLTRGRENRR